MSTRILYSAVPPQYLGLFFVFPDTASANCGPSGNADALDASATSATATDGDTCSDGRARAVADDRADAGTDGYPGTYLYCVPGAHADAHSNSETDPDKIGNTGTREPC